MSFDINKGDARPAPHKNKHLSQQIHKKKKKRTKQRRKNLLKQSKAQGSKANAKSKAKCNEAAMKMKNNKVRCKPKRPKLAKLRRSQSHNEQRQSILHEHELECDELKQLRLDDDDLKMPSLPTQSTKIEVIEPADSSMSFLFQNSPSLRPLHRFNYTQKVTATDPKTASLLWSPSVSPLLGPRRLTEGSSEMIMGFESSNANVVFRSLNHIPSMLMPMSMPRMHSVPRSGSEVTEYRYEGRMRPCEARQRVGRNLFECCSLLQSVHSAIDNNDAHNGQNGHELKESELETLSEIERLVREIRAKMRVSEQKEEEVGADSALTSRNVSLEEDNDEAQKDDEEDDDSEMALIQGAQFMEYLTPNGGNVWYYDDC